MGGVVADNDGKHVKDGGVCACILVARTAGVRGGQRDDKRQQVDKSVQMDGVALYGRFDGGEVCAERGEPDIGL